MYVGQELKSEKVEKSLRKLAPYIDADEQILGIVVCNNMRPLVDRLIATDRQLLAVSASDGVPKWQTHYAQLVDVDSALRKKTIAVRTAGGTDRVFKMVPVEDHRPFLKIVAERRQAFLPEASMSGPYPSVQSLPRGEASSVAPTLEVPEPATTAPAPYRVDDLIRLAELNESGALTDHEFAAAKARLLG